MYARNECLYFFQALVCNVNGEGDANCTNEMASWCPNFFEGDKLEANQWGLTNYDCPCT